MLKIVYTCEHFGCRIPDEFQDTFKELKPILESHLGWDPGADIIFNEFVKNPNSFNLFVDTSRLLVELNRSLDNPDLFSEYTNKFSTEIKNQILREYYFPFRKAVFNRIEELVKQDFVVLHLSIHTFTPILEGVKREADVGILFDPGRKFELMFADIWRKELTVNSELIVKHNYPYLGISDGHTTDLRKKFPIRNYIGIELEVNQKYYFGYELRFYEVIKLLTDSFYKAVDEFRV